MRRRVIAELPEAAAEIQTTQRINTGFQRWEIIALAAPRDRRAARSCQKLEGASNSNQRLQLLESKVIRQEKNTRLPVHPLRADKCFRRHTTIVKIANVSIHL